MYSIVLLACLHNIHLCTHDLFTKSRSNGCALHRPFSETDRKHLGPSPRFGSEPFKVCHDGWEARNNESSTTMIPLCPPREQRQRCQRREENSISGKNRARIGVSLWARLGQVSRDLSGAFLAPFRIKTYTLKTSVLLIPGLRIPSPRFHRSSGGKKGRRRDTFRKSPPNVPFCEPLDIWISTCPTPRVCVSRPGGIPIPSPPIPRPTYLVVELRR